MHRTLIFLILSIFIFSCSTKKNNDNNRKDKIFTFSKSELKDIDSTAILDSIRFISNDTITDNDLIFMRFNRLSSEMSNNIDIIKLKQEKTLNYLQIARLSSELSSSIYSTYKEDANKLIEEVKEDLKKDSLNRSILDSLSIQLNKSDTVTMRYLEVKSLRQYHRKDLSVVRDTVYTVFDLMDNLIRNEDIK